MTTSRPRRTAIAGARAQFADVDAEIVNVSDTGALVRTAQQHALGEQRPLLLEFGGTPVHLVARVVRCEPAAGPLSMSLGRYTLALTFVNPSLEAQTRLEHVCRAGRRAEGDARRVYVSFSRRCPKCRSRDVAKEAKRQYSCCQCGRMFTGFRVGFLRFAH